MTYSTATQTKTYRITYEFTSYHTIEVERPADISEGDLLSSITRDELVSGEDTGDVWSNLKGAWREAGPGELSITDEEGDDLFQDNPF